jgi:hypothetical protein
MPSTVTRRVAAAATLVALAIAAPVATADAAGPTAGYPVGVPPGNGCLGPISPSGVGDAGATDNQVCGGLVLAFVGPDVGQVATVVAPTIIGSVVNAPVTASAGPTGGGSVGP